MKILEIGFLGTVMIFIILMLRLLLLNRLPKRAFVILWIIVTLRLILPFSFSTVFSIYGLIEEKSLMPITENIIGISEDFYEQKENVEEITEKTEKEIQKEKQKITMIDTKETQEWNHVWRKKITLISLGRIVWIAGSVICASIFIIVYIMSYRNFQTSLPIKNTFTEEWLLSHKIRRNISIRQSDYIKVPLTYGIFHPVILMPKKTNWENREHLCYIFTHEFIHIRRLDAVIKLLLTAAICIHWFNPFVWFMYYMANRDIELSCDEAVIQCFGESSRTGYALTLINMEEVKSGLVVGNYFCKNAIEERIIAIMKNRKNSVIANIFAISLVIIISLVFATSSIPKDKADITEHVFYDSMDSYNTNSGIIDQEKETFSKQVDIETVLSKENQEELLNVYKDYGIYETSDVLYYEDKAIRCFYDQYAEISTNENGGRNINYKKVYVYFNIDGEIDLCTIRDSQTTEKKLTDIFREVKGIRKVKVENPVLYVPKTSFTKIAKKAVYEEDYSTIRKIISYVSVETVDEIVRKLIAEEKSTQNLMKYASEKTIEELAGTAYKENGMIGVRKFLPYLSQEAMDMLIEEAVKKGTKEEIAEMTLFASDK